MNEYIVSYDIAVKLKEKGFPMPKRVIFGIYEDDKSFRLRLVQSFFIQRKVVAPTISQVLKWLREVKGIDVLPQRGYINLDNNGKVTRYYNVNIYFERRFACTLDNDEQDYSTYEKAAIAGIEYVIDNLI
jgi:hypothetical protein